MIDDKKCLNCVFAKPIFLMGDVVCKYEGIVKGTDICEKYQLNMFDISKHLKKKKKTFSADDFNID